MLAVSPDRSLRSSWSIGHLRESAGQCCAALQASSCPSDRQSASQCLLIRGCGCTIRVPAHVRQRFCPTLREESAVIYTVVDVYSAVESSKRRHQLAQLRYASCCFVQKDWQSGRASATYAMSPSPMHAGSVLCVLLQGSLFTPLSAVSLGRGANE